LPVEAGSGQRKRILTGDGSDLQTAQKPLWYIRPDRFQMGHGLLTFHGFEADPSAYVTEEGRIK